MPNELSKLGYQPITLKVVRFTPPPPARPALISKVPSLQIALADPDTQSYIAGADSCNVILHNLSTRGVVAYVLGEGGDPKTGVTSSTESFNSYGQPVIDPEKSSHPQVITFGRSSRMTPQGRVELPAQPQQVIVEAALFTDGSSEGAPNVAAHLKAKQIEYLAFCRVITPLIDHIVGDPSLNDDARTVRIKEEIFRLSSEPDEATKRSMQEKFHDVPAADLATDLTRGLDDAKNEIWGDLYAYAHKCCEYPPPDHISVTQWWRNKRSHIEPLLTKPQAANS